MVLQEHMKIRSYLQHPSSSKIVSSRYLPLEHLLMRRSSHFLQLPFATSCSSISSFAPYRFSYTVALHCMTPVSCTINFLEWNSMSYTDFQLLQTRPSHIYHISWNLHWCQLQTISTPCKHIAQHLNILMGPIRITGYCFNYLNGTTEWTITLTYKTEVCEGFGD